MAWEFHPAKAAFLKFAEDWDRLNAKLYHGHPYSDSRFVGPLLDHFANGKEQLCIHRTDGVVSGALILQADGLGRWSSFRPSQRQAIVLLLDDVRVLETLLRSLPGIAWSLELYAIDPRFSPDFADLDLVKIFSPQALTIGIHPHAGFSDYWDKRSKNLRANVRRYLNRAEKEIETPSLKRFDDHSEMAAGVERFGALEMAGWKGKLGTAISLANTQGAFYSEVLARFALSGQAAVYELYVGERLAASRLVISNNQMLIILKTTYDESLARFAPGRIQLYRIIQEQMTEQPEKTIEFYTNATRDQIEWSSFRCVIQNVHLIRNDSCAAAYSVLKVLLRRLRSAGSRRNATDTMVGDPVEVKAYARIEDFSSEQYDLGEFAAKDNIETSIDWFDLLQKQVYPEDPGVRYYFVTEDKRPLIILPLRLSTQGSTKTVESLGNYYTSLYSPLLSKDGDLQAIRHLLAAATCDHQGAHVMRFAPMDKESPAYSTLSNELRAIGWIPFRYFCFGNWYLKVDSNWEGYLKKRSANLRSSIKRRSKEFSQAGGTLELVSSPVDIENAIADFQEVYSASWKIPEPYSGFVPSLIRRLCAIGMLRLGIARLEGKPIAAQLWIVGQDKASIYKVAYHKEFASYSPGTVLTSYLLQYVIEQDHVKEVDFLIGDDEYKPFWMSNRRERWGIVAYNPRTLMGLAWFMRETMGRIAKLAGRQLKITVSKSRVIGSTCSRVFTERRIKHFCFTRPQRDHVMHWTLHPVAQFPEYADQWDTLVRSRPGTPFLESGFLQPSLEFFGTGNEQLCLLHCNGRLRAAAIMQRGRKGNWQTFQPSQLPLGAWISDGKVDLKLALNELMRQLPGWPFGIGASQLDSRFQTRPDDDAELRTQDYIQTAWVDIEGSFETYWDSRGKNIKQNTRKQRTRLQADGVAMRLECLVAPEDVRQAIVDYGRLEKAGWKAPAGTAIEPDNAQGHFYRKMLENFCALGQCRIYRYLFDDKVVAMDLCIHDDTSIVILKTAYDETYKSISPSTLMRQDEFKHLFDEHKFKRIEFYGKVMEWHTRWTIQSRSIYHVTAYRWAWLRQLHKRLSAPSPLPAQEAATTTQI